MYNYFKDKKLPSTSTIYKYLSEGIIPKENKRHLPSKGTKYKRRRRGKYVIGKTIAKRPKHIHKRKEFGHWEMDTVYSGKESKNKDCLLTLEATDLSTINAEKLITNVQKINKRPMEVVHPPFQLRQEHIK